MDEEKVNQKPQEESQEDDEELSCEELNEVMKYILLKDYFGIIE